MIINDRKINAQEALHFGLAKIGHINQRLSAEALKLAGEIASRAAGCSRREGVKSIILTDRSSKAVSTKRGKFSTTCSARKIKKA
ncbi:MAG: hypothetical protein U0V48_17030 [Anaerolineales bacterium]